MSGFTFRLGPFAGGLNNAADTPDTIKDNELFKCIDFDYNIDQTLVTRPPVAVEVLTTNATLDTHYFNILGFYIDPATQINYCIANINGGLYYRIGSTSYVDATTWVAITTGIGVATAGIQYLDTFYIIFSSGAGASWSPTAGYISVAAMPAGDSIALFKERLWISAGNSSRLTFCNIGDPTTWSPSDFIDVNAGDGQLLVAVYAGIASLYLFKNASTFVFTYDSAPTAGSIQCISTTIGLFDPNCIAAYEGTIFILNGVRVYSLAGYTYNRINTKVDISRDSISGDYYSKYFISVVGDRIIVSYQNNTFIYYPLIGTWTQWDLPQTSKWFAVPNSIENYGYNIYIAPLNFNTVVGGSILSLQDKVYDVSMPPDIVRSDPQILTRMYSMDFYRGSIYDTPEHWKRLYWWGIDAIVSELDNNAQVEMSILPYTFTDFMTWRLLAGSETWEDADSRTWGSIKNDGFAISTIVDVNQPNRKFIKAKKSVRFTRIQFRIIFPGYRHTAVSSINHITINFGSKQDPVSLGEGTPVA